MSSVGNVGIGALAERVRAGDRAAFAEIYGEYAERICGFCCVLLRDRDEAADATQDVFVLVVQRVAQLRDPERFPAWIFAIARHVCYRRLRHRDRVQPAEFAPDALVTDDDPTIDLTAAEASDLVWSAAAGLNERDRAVLHLNLQQGLDGDDLAAALGVQHANPYSLLHRAKEQLERAVSALLVARIGRAGCNELSAMLENWDGALTPLVRKRVARHVEVCATCQQTRARARQLSVLGIVPLGIPSAEALRRAISSDDLVEIASRRPPDQERWLPDGFPPRDDENEKRRRRRAWLWMAAALVCAILSIGGVAVVGTGRPDRHRNATPAAVRRSPQPRKAVTNRTKRRSSVATTTVAPTVPTPTASVPAPLPPTPTTVAVSGEVLTPPPPPGDPVPTTAPVRHPPTTVPRTVPPTTAKSTTTTTIVF
jgi:RNA polymerase sigma factor (sigma-70 family)